MKNQIDRRQFLKKSVGKILPMICITLLSPISVVAQKEIANDCKNSCTSTCRGMCAIGCTAVCGFGCKFSCKAGCDGKCIGTCKNTCQATTKNANDTIKIKKDTIK